MWRVNSNRHKQFQAQATGLPSALRSSLQLLAQHRRRRTVPYCRSLTRAKRSITTQNGHKA